MRNHENWLDSTSASRLIGVAPSTLRAWAREGRIRAWRSVGGRYLYARADIIALMPEAVTTPTKNDPK